MTYDCHGPFPLQFLTKIDEIWYLTARAHFLYNSLATSLKYYLLVLGAISFTIHDTCLLGASCFIIPYRNHWNMTYDCFLYNSLPTSLKYYLWVLGAISFTIHDTWLLGALSFTIPYQDHWNMTNDCYEPFPSQFLIEINEIWDLTARGHFLYNSLSNLLKDDPWLLGVISFTILYQMIEIWPMTAMTHFLYNSLSKSLKYDTCLLGAIFLTIPYQTHWNMTYDCYGPFPLQLLIKINQVWYLTARGNFLHNSLSTSLNSDLWLPEGIIKAIEI